MSSASWTQRFSVSEKELLELRSASAGEPLRAALTSGRVSEHEYLAWAMQTYELPRLKSEFFNIAPDPVFYEAVKRDFAWNASFVPLALWNGVLLIGCLEPPQFHFRVPYETRFVLASASDLVRRFETLEPTKRVTTAQTSALSSVQAQATAQAQPKIPSQPPPPQAAPVLQPVSQTIELPPAPPAVKPQVVAEKPATAPVKVSVPVPTPPPIHRQPQVSLESLLAKPAIDLPDAPEISLDEPDGLVNVPKQATDDRMIVPDGISLGSIEMPKPEPVTAKVAVSDAPDGMSEKTFVTQAKIDFSSLTGASADQVATQPSIQMAPPSTALAEEVTNPRAKIDLATIEMPANESTNLRAAETTNPQAKIAPFPPTVPRPMPQPTDFNTVVGRQATGTSIVKNDAAIVALAQCANYDELASSALGRVLSKFDVGMILLFQNGLLKPWKWTEMMYSVKGDEPDPIDLDHASIFRIVFRTCLPYPGYVVGNPVNTQFFNAFHRGVTAKHATIMPVLINKKVAGMILGLANHEVDLRKTLGEMEVLSAEFGTHLDRVKNIKKAA
ncbi:MAG: hypothetical protein V4760_18635 [Bdellovibrionota bacterium]